MKQVEIFFVNDMKLSFEDIERTGVYEGMYFLKFNVGNNEVVELFPPDQIWRIVETKLDTMIRST